MQYKLTVGFDEELTGVTIVGRAIAIPNDPANSDYQAYLEWVAEGNEALPADPFNPDDD